VAPRSVFSSACLPADFPIFYVVTKKGYCSARGRNATKTAAEEKGGFSMRIFHQLAAKVLISDSQADEIVSRIRSPRLGLEIPVENLVSRTSNKPHTADIRAFLHQLIERMLI